MLDHAVVFAGRRHDLAGFEDVMRARLFDVDILAGLAGPDRSERVPVVGGGQGDGVDGLVLEQLAVVGVGSRALLGLFLDLLGPFLEHGFVHVAQCRHLGVRKLGIAVDMGAAAAANAHAGHADSIVGASQRAGTKRRAGRRR